MSQKVIDVWSCLPQLGFSYLIIKGSLIEQNKEYQRTIFENSLTENYFKSKDYLVVTFSGQISVGCEDFYNDIYLTYQNDNLIEIGYKHNK